MELQMFQYIEEVLGLLDEREIELDIVRREIKSFFQGFLEDSNRGYLNISSRVKAKQSLKEKILRYDYFASYPTKEALFDNLSDLIGIRLECRFIGDETAIYKWIKTSFKVPSTVYDGFFSTKANPHLLLELKSKQPKSQKNGLKMYRIDGKYLYQDLVVNFEVQIKSLVNIFWSEIEHKVIYKNYNYIIADRFYKDIMNSIKNSLTTIDQQLLLISSQFDTGDETSSKGRKLQLEKLLSKTIYDLFAAKMRQNIGILVDFRKSCDTLVKYVFREVLFEDEHTYNSVLVGIFERLNMIENAELDFREELTFERVCQFEDAFSYEIGTFIQSVINDQFQWTLFFKILFEIEPDNNSGDFEKFISFYKTRLYRKVRIDERMGDLAEEEIYNIVDAMMVRFAKIFVQMNSVEALYDNVIEQIVSIRNSVMDMVCRNIIHYSDWEKDQEIYLKLFELRIYSAFEMEIEATQVLDFLEDVRNSEADIDIHKSIVKHIDKL